MAYDVYLGKILLPITPSEISIKIGNNNKTVTLIDGSNINVLNSPKLTEVSFKALLPQVKYPFAVYRNGFIGAGEIIKEIEKMKTSLKPFQFIVSRCLPSGKILFDTNITVSLEELSLTESAENGFDIEADIKLKQYREYATKVISINSDGSINQTQNRPSYTANDEGSTSAGQTYVIKSKDTLWGIAKRFLASGARSSEIYELNKTVIEAAAKKHGRQSSSKGWWIYPGTEIHIPQR